MPEPPPPAAADTHPSPSNRHGATLPMAPPVPCCWLKNQSCRNTRLSSATHKPLLPLSCCRVTPTSSSGRHSQLYCCCVLCRWDRLSLNCRACLWTRAPDSMWNPPAPQSRHHPLSRFPFLFCLRLFFSSQAGTSVRTPHCCIIAWLRSQKYG